jgi:putative FmdB family regulatory protein
MPTYNYECKDCGKGVEAVRGIADRNNCPRCECGGETFKVVSRPNVNPDYEPYLDDNIMPHQSTGEGVWVKSRRHREEIMKRNGLVATG